jgi:hypothetical protein
MLLRKTKRCFAARKYFAKAIQNLVRQLAGNQLMRNFVGADDGNRQSSRHDIRKAVRLQIPDGLSIFTRVNSFGLP